MIQGFEPSHPLEPELKDRVQWSAAVSASLLTGLILLVIPRGSPWAGLTFFSPAVLGRNLTSQNVPLPESWLIHMAGSMIYGLIICRVVAGLHQTRAIMTGGLSGLVLYVVNFGVVSTWWPQIRGNEVGVLFTHLVFGFVVAGAYRGLLRRRSAA